MFKMITDWLSENWQNVLVAGIVVLVVVLIVVKLVKDKKKGKNCCCNCDDCEQYCPKKKK